MVTPPTPTNHYSLALPRKTPIKLSMKFHLTLQPCSLVGRYLSELSTKYKGENPPLAVWDEILWSPGPEPLPKGGRTRVNEMAKNE